MTRAWRQTAAAGLTATLLFAAGCGGAEPKGSPAPTSSTTPPTASSAPTSVEPGGPPADWKDKYNAAELEAYEAALSNWQRYQQLAAPIDAAGKYTPQAERLYKKYVVTWQASVSQLRDAEQAGVRVEVPPVALWTIAESIALSKGGSIDGALLVIRQCMDYSEIRVTKNGDDVTATVRPEHTFAPLLIEMTNLGGIWKKLKTTVEEKSCAP